MLQIIYCDNRWIVTKPGLWQNIKCDKRWNIKKTYKMWQKMKYDES